MASPPEQRPVGGQSPKPVPPPLPQSKPPAPKSRTVPPLPKPPLTPRAAPALPTPKPAGYRADFSRIHAARLLALALSPLVAFRVLPVLIGDAAATSRWGIWSIAIAGLVAAYLAWMAITPDWSATRVCGWAFGVSAVLYATAAGMFLFTPSWRGEELGVQTSPFRAALWCCAVTLLDALGAYLALRAAHRWKRAVLAKRLPVGF